MAKWTTNDITPLHGIRALITGTGGLGLETALALSRAGAEVIIAGRNPSKGVQAAATIQQQIKHAQLHFEVLDLADLGSIAQLGQRLRAKLPRLDILINNAGVMAPPQRQRSMQGFELQFATNYLGHFALTAQLLPLLRQATNARVISLSSLAARQGKINFSDLHSQQRYKPTVAYSQSKLACLMFAFELQRRSQASSWGVNSIAVHPGIARTDLLVNGAGNNSLFAKLGKVLGFLFQPAAQGALPSLFAATSPQAEGAGYYGPDRLGETRGYPTTAAVPARAKDIVTAAELWELSEQLIGYGFSSITDDGLPA